MSDERRDPITIYTQTLLEILVSAAEQGKDQQLRQVLKEIRAKGIRKGDVLRYATNHLQADGVQRVQSGIASLGRGAKKAG